MSTLWPDTETESLVPDAQFDEVDEIGPHAEFQQDPIGWAVRVLGVPEYSLRWSMNDGYGDHAWDGDVDPLVAVADALRDWTNVGVESATGTGKSYFMAVMTLWFLACFKNSRVFTFAPKADQLRLFIWKEIRDLWPRFHPHFPDAELTDLCLRINGGTDDSWGARGYAVAIKAGEGVSSNAQGMHAEHMLLIYEETPGIAMAVLDAGENTCTAPHNLRVAIGNPNHRQDTLHRFCTSPDVRPVRISALDHPNVVTENPNLIPGAVSQASINRRLAKYGAGSPVYESRVKGLSPAQASDALIRLEWLEAARNRYELRKANGTLPTLVTGKGVDVANSEHGDRGAICDFGENVMLEIRAFACPDSNQLGRDVYREMTNKSLRQGSPLPAYRVGVDAIGVGAGTVNELRRLGQSVQAINNSAVPVMKTERAPDGHFYEWVPDANQFRNFRSQSYWQAREDLRKGVIDVPYDAELWEELTAPTFEDEPKTVVMSKGDIKDVIGRSPDKADAFVMANWVRERKVIEKDQDDGEREGKSRGYDFEKHKPRTHETGDQVFQRMFGNKGRQSPTAGRYRVPKRS